MQEIRRNCFKDSRGEVEPCSTHALGPPSLHLDIRGRIRSDERIRLIAGTIIRIYSHLTFHSSTEEMLSNLASHEHHVYSDPSFLQKAEETPLHTQLVTSFKLSRVEIRSMLSKRPLADGQQSGKRVLFHLSAGCTLAHTEFLAEL